ncbi:NADP-dependent oxidoreductase [Paractinoplanes atraurantiacus]|uniref:NADPH:quinone reductase n=1 Tax=Paractinoplanes atraurantiacus TaxID=1036182 RepID=A0A285IPD4_9ACTN|nr:NADP-dependent oxidoreductase [Actinoplanes atraurantiacus]SNY49804.1 NADPH:quinone reductase [Actinoplanes atraurantiacus]
MRAAAFEKPGPPEVLREMEVPTPHAGAGEVRVRVRAAGVQPYDCAVREGWNPAGAPPGFPRIPGNEFAGVVDQVGAGVTDAREGQEVIGFGMLGAYAEYIVVPAEHVTAKPAGMPWEVAGGFSAGAQTAHIALLELGLAKGDTLLIHGAAGAVGTVAVQLGVAWGATVIGTAAPANHDYLRGLGAVPVSYGQGLASRVRDVAPQGIDAVLDGAGGEALDVSLGLTGNVLTLVDHGREGVKVTPPLRSRERLAELAGMYADGLLRVHVRAAYPLARAADAHRDVGSGHGRGKVVVTL